MLETDYVNVPEIPNACRLNTRTDFNTLPNIDLRPGIERWVHLGIKPGDFLTAVITNNLKLAVTYADDTNLRLLPDIVRWFFNNVPASAWGGESIAKSWQESREEALEYAKKLLEERNNG